MSLEEVLLQLLDVGERHEEESVLSEKREPAGEKDVAEFHFLFPERRLQTFTKKCRLFPVTAFDNNDDLVRPPELSVERRIVQIELPVLRHQVIPTGQIFHRLFCIERRDDGEQQGNDHDDAGIPGNEPKQSSRGQRRHGHETTFLWSAE